MLFTSFSLLANIRPEGGLVNDSKGRILGFLPHRPLVREREQRLAASGEFSRFQQEQIQSWVEGQAPGFPFPVVRLQNGVQ